MRALPLIAKATVLINTTGMGLAYLDNDPTVFAFSWGAATLAGCALLLIKSEEDKRMHYRDIATRMRWEIKEEGYRPGQPLPSIRELAERLGASRSNVRRALVVLTREGLIDMVHGKGTFVAGALHADRAGLIEAHIRGRVGHGEPIEPAEALALAWSVSPSTVRRVLSKLHNEGVIRRCRNGSWESAQ